MRGYLHLIAVALLSSGGLLSLAEPVDVRAEMKVAARAIEVNGAQRCVRFDDIEDIRNALQGEGFSKENIEPLRVGRLAKLFENQEVYSKGVWLEKRYFSISAHVHAVKKECWLVRVPIR